MLSNFRIDIFINPAPSQHSEYLVELREGGMSLAQLQTRIDRQALLQHEHSFNARDYGLALYEMVFAGKVGREYQRLLARAGSDSTVRVQLVISDYAAELHALPWERLFYIMGDTEIPLAASAQTPFSRFLVTGAGDLQPVNERPLRLLLAIANPQGLPPGLGAIDVASEVTALADLLAGTRGQVTGTVLPGRSGLPASLRERLENEGWSIAGVGEVTSWDNIQRRLPGHHVLHILAHGQFRQDDGQAFLLLEDEGTNGAIRGSLQRVADQEIVDGLKGVQPLPYLVFLAACDSAKRPDDGANPFVGLGPKLVQAGVPAVVAMQDQVPMDLAHTLASDFYRRLFEHGRVDHALNEARSLAFERDAFAWGIPVLFLHMEDGQLWAPDPDWTALRDAMQGLQADETFAYVADDRGTYLRLPVDLAPLARERFLQQHPPSFTGSAAGIPFVDATRRTLRDEDSRLIVVTGHYGSNLTTQLKRFVWLEMCQALSRFNGLVDPGSGSILAGDVPLRLPIFASLGELRHGRARYPGDPVLGLVLHKLQGARGTERDAPGITAHRLERLFREAGLRLVLVLDDDDTLSEREQRNSCTTVFEFMARAKSDHLDHKGIMAVRPAYLEADGPFSKQDFHLLGVQHMARQKVRHFLQSEAKQHRWAESLLNQIDQSGYFDLIAVPWFMVMLVEQARNGFCPRSRTEVITTIVDDAIDQVVRDIASWAQSPSSLQPISQGLEENVRQIVYDLAWQMQFGYTDTASLVDTLALIERHRGHRQYGVEPMYSALVKRRLLAPRGSDGVRFAYRGMQSYCCAKAVVQHPNAGHVLDNVVANLGRLTRLRWWEDTLVFACGLMTHKLDLLNSVLEVIVYGMDPGDNEQVFMAARCIAESSQAAQTLARDGEEQLRADLDKVADTIAVALSWRLDDRYESRSAERSRAAELLGHLTYPPRVRELVNVAYRKSRWDRRHTRTFDHSDVRMAAVVGLLKVTPDDRFKLLKSLDRQGVLAQMLEEWTLGQVDKLVVRVREGANVAAQGIAVMALGDLYGRLIVSASPEDHELAGKALNTLTAQFQNPATNEDTLWALAYALAMIDLPTVTRAMVEGGLWVGPGQAESMQPLSDERVAAFFQEWSQRDEQQKFLAYLIGLTQWSDPHALHFLHENCLKQNTSRVNLAAVAIDALSRVGSASTDVPLLERIALGNWDDVLGLRKPKAKDREYLQRKALEALASLGDIACVDRLRQHARLLKWSPSLERALYVTSEKIFWRLYWNRGM